MLNYTDLKGKELIHKCRMNACTTCGGPVNAFFDPESKKVFIACSQYPSTKHESISRESEIQRLKGKWVIEMENEMGEKKALALRQYQGLTALTKDDATIIVKTIWPGASGPEVFKAINVCVTYGLNPLMKHVYLIPFKDGDKQNYVCVLGIGANRLIARRKHTFTYLDDTPRIMNEAEEIKKYGKADKTKLRFVTKLKDIPSGAEASGWGEVSATAIVYGTDKGNSRENIGSIRSERQALDRLYPADMPAADIPVMDENYIDGEARVVEEQPKEPATVPDQKPAETQQNEQGKAEPPKPVLTFGQRLTAAMKANKYTEEQIKAHLKANYHVDATKDLKDNQKEELILEVENNQVSKKG